MKKIIASLFVVALVVVMAVSAMAATPVNDFEYEANAEGITIKKYKGADTEIEIPATIDGKAVTVIGESAFNDMRSITKIVIPEGVKTIEKQAFYSTRGLTEVILPDSVTSIGDEAFYACIAAKKLSIGSKVTTIEGNPFGRFSALETLTVAAGCPALKIENDCLVDVTSKTVLTGIPKETIILPAGIEAVGNHAFYGTGNATSVIRKIVVPAGVKTIGNSAFDATALGTLVLPKSLVSIGNALAANTPLHKNKLAQYELGNIYYEGTEAEYALITKGSSNNAISGANAPITYNSCVAAEDYKHNNEDPAKCTLCNPPAGGNQGGNQNQGGANAPQTGSSVTVLAVVAVVALAATSVVIKRRIED